MHLKKKVLLVPIERAGASSAGGLFLGLVHIRNMHRVSQVHLK